MSASPAPPFQGLTMPVFTAFGWAGEDQAMKFALAQLQVFIERLHAHMSTELRTMLPYSGIDRGGQLVYLSHTEDPSDGIHVTFRATPMNLIATLAVTDKKVLGKMFTRLSNTSEDFFKRAKLLDEGWDMRLQQMEIMDDAGTETSHYQDVFKDGIDTLDEESANEVIARGAYLNNDPKWVAPLFFTHRTNAETIAFMRTGVIDHMSTFLQSTVPIIRLLTGMTGKKVVAKKKKTKAKPRAAAAKATSAKALRLTKKLENFTYISELKGLHIRKGFINLTPEHWTFFAKSARANTREVTLKYGEDQIGKATAWRLVSNGQARLVLDDKEAQWMGNTVGINEHIQVEASKVGVKGDITVTLTPVA